MLNLCYEVVRDLPKQHLVSVDLGNKVEERDIHLSIRKRVQSLRNLGIRILPRFISSEAEKREFNTLLEDVYSNLGFHISMGPRWLMTKLDKINSAYLKLKREKEEGMSYRERILQPVLYALAEAQRDSAGYAWVSGEVLQQATGLFPHEINDAVTVLKDSGLVELRLAGGTAPFVFQAASITSRGRIECGNAKSAQKIQRPKMIEANLISSTPKPSKEIFIVHGHNEEMKQVVARTLEKLELEPIILHEKPDEGRTLIEKFHDHTNVSFAVVLLSADDMAYSKEEKPEKAKPRTRQNVIFELGFFVGKLGRKSVLVLYHEEDEFQMPTDYSGVLYVPYDKSGSWRLKLAQELKAFGYKIDTNKLL